MPGPKRKPSRTRAAQSGFSLLESLVAVALIAAAFLPLLTLQGQLTRTVVALERAEANVKDMSSALSYLRVMNPSKTTEGTQPLGDATLSWRARPVSEERPALGQGGAPGRFMLQLFDIDAVIAYEDGRQAEFTVRALGWRATRPVSESLG